MVARKTLASRIHALATVVPKGVLRRAGIMLQAVAVFLLGVRLGWFDQSLDDFCKIVLVTFLLGAA